MGDAFAGYLPAVGSGRPRAAQVLTFDGFLKFLPSDEFGRCFGLVGVDGCQRPGNKPTSRSIKVARR